jgi:hypothetical protein
LFSRRFCGWGLHRRSLFSRIRKPRNVNCINARKIVYEVLVLQLTQVKAKEKISLSMIMSISKGIVWFLNFYLKFLIVMLPCKEISPDHTRTIMAWNFIEQINCSIRKGAG